MIQPQPYCPGENELSSTSIFLLLSLRYLLYLDFVIVPGFLQESIVIKENLVILCKSLERLLVFGIELFIFEFVPLFRVLSRRPILLIKKKVLGSTLGKDIFPATLGPSALHIGLRFSELTDEVFGGFRSLTTAFDRIFRKRKKSLVYHDESHSKALTKLFQYRYSRIPSPPGVKKSAGRDRAARMPRIFSRSKPYTWQ